MAPVGGWRNEHYLLAPNGHHGRRQYLIVDTSFIIPETTSCLSVAAAIFDHTGVLEAPKKRIFLACLVEPAREKSAGFDSTGRMTCCVAFFVSPMPSQLHADADLCQQHQPNIKRQANITPQP